MRIGIYGGTFDPIHYGHLLLAETSRETLRLDRVIFIPAKIPPHKQGLHLTSEEHRVEMLRRALEGNTAFELDLFELQRNQVSFTIYTLEYLHQKYPEAELFLLMGEDMLRIFPQWFEPKRICELAIPAIIGRAGHEISDISFLRGIASKDRLKQILDSRVPMPAVAFSSTAIREAVAQGRSIRYQMPDSVIQYIAANGLYR